MFFRPRLPTEKPTMRHTITTEIRVNGMPLSPGLALGRPCFYEPSLRSAALDCRSVADEGKRLCEALGWMTDRLAILAAKADENLGREAGDVFRTHCVILEDPDLQQRLFEAIEIAGLDAERAVEKELELYQARLRTLDSAYMRERAADVGELQRGLLDRLRRSLPAFRCRERSGCAAGDCELGNDHIVLAPELTPCLAVDIDRHTRGFVVEKGARSSHAAIMARALGLPAVSGIENLRGSIPLGAECLVNGDTGEVILNPGTETRRRYHGMMGGKGRQALLVEPVSHLKVMANVDCRAGLQDALAAKAEGIGLARTEVEALTQGRLPTEAEQATLFGETVAVMAGQPVYIRLLDLGGDKGASWLGLPAENNPALGCRGARLLLSRPELVRTQARALARASRHGPIRVVYPMIRDLDEFRALRSLFGEAIGDLGPGQLLHGIMFEVPSACLQARRLFREVDFACIGSNDLVQYLFATDRSEQDPQYDQLLEKPMLWDLIKRLAGLASEVGKPLSLCGDLAGNTRFTRRILEAGITRVTTEPRNIGRVRLAAQAAVGAC